ncbi:MAG: YciI family protein [Melioribacteraceae bacterium]|nr:YciI family protein [Melioribacteraceae bacterium]
MKNILFLVFTFLAHCIQAQNKNYDEQIARELGADDFGMKNYIFVLLKTGPSKIEDKKTRDSLFAGHMKNIQKLADEKKLIVAGPFGKNNLNYRGLFIFDLTSIEEVKKCLEEDPTIKEKIFDVEIIPWYGSAALKEYLKTADKIWKTKP